jgi:hypothetical protein
MPRILPRFLRRRRKTVPPEPPAPPHPALDRSQLLAELEVNVPAPRRIVSWEGATGSRFDAQRLSST